MNARDELSLEWTPVITAVMHARAQCQAEGWDVDRVVFESPEALYSYWDVERPAGSLSGDYICGTPIRYNPFVTAGTFQLECGHTVYTFDMPKADCNEWRGRCVKAVESIIEP